jgi:hypothetical protein
MSVNDQFITNQLLCRLSYPGFNDLRRFFL